MREQLNNFAQWHPSEAEEDEAVAEEAEAALVVVSEEAEEVVEEAEVEELTAAARTQEVESEHEEDTTESSTARE